MDLLNSIVKKGAMSVQQSFTSHVGIGSREVFARSIIIKCVTSLIVVNVKAISSLGDVQGMMGGGVLVVEARMLVIFFFEEIRKLFSTEVVIHLRLFIATHCFD